MRIVLYSCLAIALSLFPGCFSDDDSDSSSSGSTIYKECLSNSDLSTTMLDSVNNARAQARTCGSESMPAVPALTWDSTLEKTACWHSTDMGENNYFSHTGSDDSSVADRAEEAEYTYRAVGENIAANQADVAAVMDSWLNSEGHCKNIMNANFTEMGASLVETTTGDYSKYWTQVFGKPAK